MWWVNRVCMNLMNIPNFIDESVRVSEYCFTSLSAHSRQYRDRRKPEVEIRPYSYRMTPRVLYSAQYHRQRCTIQAFEQFGALYVHNPDDKHPTRSGFESSEFRATTGPNEPSGQTRKLEEPLHLKQTTALFSLSDHYILSREWRVIVDEVQNNYRGRSNGTIISQMWPSCWLWRILIMVGCVLSQA